MGIQIKATFLDEITADIPHQNWGKEEWDKDFAAMKAVGIDTVIMIRSGLEKFITYPSKILIEEFGCYEPPVDLVDMFLELAEKYDMRYFFGTYCLRHNGHYKDVDVDARWSIEKRLIDEVWERYGHRKAFKGWYLAKEISGNDEAIVREFVNYSSYCKKISGNLPTLISPGMLGRKAWMPNEPGAHDLDFEHHERTWDTIMKAISGHVDIIAFQDGHVTYEELGPAMALNKRLADKYGIELWTNSETFDRDMPIRFLPIKWEKLRYKLKKAEEAGVTRALTFEFSHFMSPNSMYHSAHHLYNRYREYLENECK